MLYQYRLIVLGGHNTKKHGVVKFLIFYPLRLRPDTASCAPVLANGAPPQA